MNAPRKTPAWSLWAKENKDLVLHEAGVDANIGKRNQIAASLFKQQPDDVRQLLEERALALFEEAKEQYRAALAGTTQLGPEEQQR